MELGEVVGQVVTTVRDPGMPPCSLLLIELWGSTGNTRHVAADPLGAGVGEWVLLTRGSSARQGMSGNVPVDLCVVGIVDEVVAGGKPLYVKSDSGR